MDWKDVGKTVGKFAPMLGTLIAGPEGGAIGAVVASALGVEKTPDAISQAIAVNPDAAVKLADIERSRQTQLAGVVMQTEANRLQAETSALAAVNATMQAETASQHWPSYTWRPFIGFCIGFNTIMAALTVLLVFAAVVFGAAQAPAAVSQLPMVLGSLAALTATVAPIVGIASWFRGKAQADPNIQTDNRG